MFRSGLAMLLVLGAVSTAPAASWADAMFEDLSRDFGSVPRGPTLSHSFRLTNRSDAPVHISNVRVSCGCVTATALQTDLAPGQTGTVLAQMDTRRFTGPKTVTIYVQFDRPQWEEVRLWVQANGRDDVSLSAEGLAFGQVRRGSGPTTNLSVTFLGNNDWQITETACESNYVQTKTREIRREGSEVVYEVAARVRPDAPVGKWYTDVWLTTNNPAMPRVRLPVTVEIESALSVSPSTAVLGQVKIGEETERRVIVRGVKPFKITKVDGTDGQLSVRDSSAESKPVHVLTIKLKPAVAGELSRTLKVRTDLPEDNEIEFLATAQVAQKSQKSAKSE